MPAQPLYPPFIPVFGSGAPGASVPHNTLYYDVSTNPFTSYVYRAGAWHTCGALGSGVNAGAIDGISVDLTGIISGQVLGYDGTDIVPVTPSGGGAAGAVAQWDTGASGNSGSAYAFKGITFIPQDNITVSGIGGLVTQVNGATYKGVLATLSSGSSTSPQITALTSGNNIVGVGTSKRWLWSDFTAPQSLVAGTPYAFLFGRTDSTGTYVLPIVATTSVNLIPALPGNGIFFAADASANPTIGDTLFTNSGAVPGVGVAIGWSK